MRQSQGNFSAVDGEVYKTATQFWGTGFLVVVACRFGIIWVWNFYVKMLFVDGKEQRDVFCFNCQIGPKLCVCVNICALCALCVFLGGSVSFAGPGSLMAQDNFKKNHVGDLYKNEFQLFHKLEVKL